MPRATPSPAPRCPTEWLQISPDTSPRYSGGYRSGAPFIEGFSQNHMSGVGCSGDLGNILLMPTVGAVGTTETAYRSGYSDEAASPGYYRVTLTKGGIGAEMSATTRATIARFTFPERDGDANILVDVSHGLTPSRDGLVRIVSPTEVEGYNDTGGFCGERSRLQGLFRRALQQARGDDRNLAGYCNRRGDHPHRRGCRSLLSLRHRRGRTGRGPARALLCRHRGSEGQSDRRNSRLGDVRQGSGRRAGKVEQRPRPGRPSLAGHRNRDASSIRRSTTRCSIQASTVTSTAAIQG